MRPPLETIAALLEQGSADSAVRMLRNAWDPDLATEHRVPVYLMWIRGLCETEEFEPAVVLARRAAEEFPREPDVLVALGNVLDLVGELEEAKEAFALAVDVDPDNALAHYNLGAVLDRIGDHEEAKEQYSLAVYGSDDGPSMVEAVTALGALLRRQDNVEDALEVYERYLEEDPVHTDILVEHGICLSDLDRLDEAIDRFDEALTFLPGHAGALYNLAITQYRAGRSAEALETMSRARAAEPDNPLTLAVLGGWLLADTAQVDTALRHLYQAIELLEELRTTGDLNPAYAGLVVEEVFEGLWSTGRRQEAHDIYLLAGRYDWSTPHMLSTVAEAENQPKSNGTTFTVSARARAKSGRPEHWPCDASGYTTDLAVVASDEAEARTLTIAYLRRLEPGDTVSFDVRIVQRNDADANDEGPRTCGVVGVVASRAYFRHSQRPRSA
ncbi:MAG: tetratricopeptide repeat protein [Myxococcales bacterium FL481]|nr:MAG: tetratricopeptide repeat protein [Myxococcales bacterium FL481]